MRNMQKMWEDYAKEVQVLRERIAELREVLQRDKTTPAFSRSSTYSAVPLSASRAVIKKLIPYMIVEVMAENIRKIPPNIRHILPFIA